MTESQACPGLLSWQCPSQPCLSYILGSHLSQPISASFECDQVGGKAGVGESFGGPSQMVDPQRSVLALAAESESSAHNQLIKPNKPTRKCFKNKSPIFIMKTKSEILLSFIAEN